MTPRDRSRRGWRFYCTPRGVRNKGLSTQKTYSTCICTVSKWRVETSQERRWLLEAGRERDDVIPFPRGVRNKGLITQKTWIRRAFAQLSKCSIDTSQLRQRLPGTSGREVDDSTVSPDGSEIKGYSLNKRKRDVHSHSFQDTELKFHK